VSNLNRATSKVLSFPASRRSDEPSREDLSRAGLGSFRALLWSAIIEAVIILGVVLGLQW
jgi:hypothetical protein